MGRSTQGWPPGGAVQLGAQVEHLTALDKRDTKWAESSISWDRSPLLYFPVPPLFKEHDLWREEELKTSVYNFMEHGNSHVSFSDTRDGINWFTVWICVHFIGGDLSLVNHKVLNRLMESFLENNKLGGGCASRCTTTVVTITVNKIKWNDNNNKTLRL